MLDGTLPNSLWLLVGSQDKDQDPIDTDGLAIGAEATVMAARSPWWVENILNVSSERRVPKFPLEDDQS